MNETQSLSEIVVDRLTQIPETWEVVRSGFVSIQVLPSNLCHKYWLFEALISQLAPFPFCYSSKYFARYQNYFLFIFVLTGALYGWVKQISNRNQNIEGPFDTPFFQYTAPCVFQAQLEIFSRLFKLYFWPDFPTTLEHFLVLVTRYETFITLFTGASIVGLVFHNLPSFVCFIWNGMVNILQWIICRRMAEQTFAVIETRERWRQTDSSLQTSNSTPEATAFLSSTLTLTPSTSTPTTRRRRN